MVVSVPPIPQPTENLVPDTSGDVVVGTNLNKDPCLLDGFKGILGSSCRSNGLIQLDPVGVWSVTFPVMLRSFVSSIPDKSGCLFVFFEAENNTYIWRSLSKTGLKLFASWELDNIPEDEPLTKTETNILIVDFYPAKAHYGSLVLVYLPTWKPIKINHPCSSSHGSLMGNRGLPVTQSVGFTPSTMGPPGSTVITLFGLFQPLEMCLAFIGWVHGNQPMLYQITHDFYVFNIVHNLSIDNDND